MFAGVKPRTLVRTFQFRKLASQSEERKTTDFSPWIAPSGEFSLFNNLQKLFRRYYDNTLTCQKYTTGLQPVDSVHSPIFGRGIFLSMLKNHWFSNKE